VIAKLMAKPKLNNLVFIFLLGRRQTISVKLAT
jgi:hypothetical protein